MFKRFLFVSALALITGCSKQKGFVPVYDVPVEFQRFVRAFIDEAAKRGHTYIINNLIIKYDPALPYYFCGKSNTYDPEAPVQKVISINPNIKCWNNDQELETLIFHEMGHCILGRLHDSTRLPNGNPKTLMIANNLSLYSPCVYPIDGEPCDQSFKRSYYIDELFDAGTPVPEWAK